MKKLTPIREDFGVLFVKDDEGAEYYIEDQGAKYAEVWKQPQYLLVEGKPKPESPIAMDEWMDEWFDKYSMPDGLNSLLTHEPESEPGKTITDEWVLIEGMGDWPRGLATIHNDEGAVESGINLVALSKNPRIAPLKKGDIIDIGVGDGFGLDLIKITSINSNGTLGIVDVSGASYNITVDSVKSVCGCGQSWSVEVSDEELFALNEIRKDMVRTKAHYTNQYEFLLLEKLVNRLNGKQLKKTPDIGAGDVGPQKDAQEPRRSRSR